MEPQIRYAQTSDGVSIAYCFSGEGQPLVLAGPPSTMHCQLNWKTFAGLYLPLAGRLRLISYDPRGTGLSDRSALDFSIEAMVRDLEAVVLRTGLGSFALAAFMDAVPVAITFAARNPARLSKLVILDGYTSAADFLTSAAGQAHTALLEQDWVLYTDTLAHVLMGIDDPQHAAAIAEHMRAAIEPEAFRQFMADELTWDDVSPLLGRITAPTLVLHSKDNAFIPATVAQRIAAAIPDAGFLLIDDKGYRHDVAPLIIDFVVGEIKTPDTGQTQGAGPAEFRTIMFTDITDSTSLTQRLGDAKAQALVHAHNQIVREALRAQGGTEIKHTGDGIMASFTSASAALHCAAAIERSIAAQNRDLPADAQRDGTLSVHIGVNAGEPVAEGSDLFGTAVQLARRVCDHAAGGEILVADVVRQLAAGKDFLFADRGETVLRGFEDPVRLYELRWREDS